MYDGAGRQLNGGERRHLAERRGSPMQPVPLERRRGLPDRRGSLQRPTTLPSPLPLDRSLLPLVSHELRTPITTIQGYAELLQRRLRGRDPDGELSGPVSVIAGQVRRLNALIDELIDLSELSHPDARLQQQRLDLAALASEVAATVQAQARKHTVVVEAASPLPVRGDGARLRELVDHLLRNAVKYSPDGGEVVLRAWATDEHVLLVVADQGIGIAPEHLPRIFDPFYQTEPATQRRFGGLGLGLTICRAIAERHGGEVWAESTPGRGSAFYVRLPHADAVASSAPSSDGV